jgi:hypothetical protein
MEFEVQPDTPRDDFVFRMPDAASRPLTRHGHPPTHQDQVLARNGCFTSAIHVANSFLPQPTADMPVSRVIAGRVPWKYSARWPLTSLEGIVHFFFFVYFLLSWVAFTQDKSPFIPFVWNDRFIRLSIPSLLHLDSPYDTSLHVDPS